MCTNYIDITKVDWNISALIWPNMVQFVRKQGPDFSLPIHHSVLGLVLVGYYCKYLNIVFFGIFFNKKNGGLGANIVCTLFNQANWANSYLEIEFAFTLNNPFETLQMPD